MTVRELIEILLDADMNQKVYVDSFHENSACELESVEKNIYNWGVVIGKVEMV